MNFLNSPGADLVRTLGGGKVMDKLVQIQDTAAWTPAQERQARAAGFPSAQAAMDFQRQRQQVRPPQTVAGGGAPQEQSQDPRGGNAMGWHPSNVFSWLRDTLASANSRGQ